MVNVQVDGAWHRFPKGTRMIEACRQAGADVPHYCYHPKLTSPGNCRMCLVEMGMPPRLPPGEKPELDAAGRPVEIQWMPRAAISCANTVAEGMGIRTQSELAKSCREGVMEFLLINHPLDCPICDQAGECSLQEFSVAHGTGSSRFREQKVKKPKNVPVGPRVRLDDERCIMCSRCIRFCDEVADDPVLGFTDRGSHTVLATHPDKKLENDYSLNTVDICPVGALTSEDFRFQMRVWFLKETPSVCTLCARGCNTTIGSRDGKVLRQTPRQNDAVNSAWMCDQGRLDFHFVHSARRLAEPLIREGEGHRPARWKEAIAAAAEGLLKAKEAGEGDKSGVALVASARMTNEELHLAKGLADALGATTATVPRHGGGDPYLRADDLNPNSHGARLILGGDPPGRLDAIIAGVRDGSVKSLVVLGENVLKAGFTDGDLAKVDFLVTADILAGPVPDASHVVLPTAAYAEKRGTMINATGRLQRLGKAVDPPGSARDDWEVLLDLAKAITGGNGIGSLDDVMRSLGAAVPEFAGVTYGSVTGAGIDLVETGEKVPLLERERERREKGLIVG